MLYKLTIEYDGTNYIGWQMQLDQPMRSIEEILQRAIFLITNQEVKVAGSGRTDGGVHAIAQVAHIDLSKEFKPFNLMMGINSQLLHEKIVITNCEIVDDNFHSRYDAKKRHYQYQIINRKAPLALEKNRAWHVAVDLDIEAMKQAAEYLIGEHDFSAFRDAECQAPSPVKTLDKINISNEGNKISIDVSAKSFLHHMVRNIVGTLVWVGIGKIKADDVKMILESRDRTKSGPNAPAHGLYFVGVDY